MTAEQALRLLNGGPAGINEWNARREQGEAVPDLRHSLLIRADLDGACLGDVDLSGCILSGARLDGADLRQANLHGADLANASLLATDLSKAVLSEASLHGACLRTVSLVEADLRHAILVNALLQNLLLTGASLHHATFGNTLVDTDLSDALGLEDVRHCGPSQVTIDSVRPCRQDLPEAFLKGCGWTHPEITFFREPTGQYCRCFISYSSQDEMFAEKLYQDLGASGIPCWKWNHEGRTGNPLWHEIDHAIRLQDKVVLIASKHSLTSAAVLRELERALRQEDHRQERRRTDNTIDVNVLFPVRLDDYVFQWDHPRSADVLQKIIADACGWDTDPDKYRNLLRKLIDDLRRRQ